MKQQALKMANFDNNEALKLVASSNGHISIPDTYTDIGDDAFANISAKSVKIPNTIGIIGSRSFAGLPLKKINIPDSVITIQDEAFKRDDDTNGPKKVRVRLGRGIKEIGDRAFQNLRIKQLVLPKGLQRLGKASFLGSDIKKLRLHLWNIKTKK